MALDGLPRSERPVYVSLLKGILLVIGKSGSGFPLTSPLSVIEYIQQTWPDILENAGSNLDGKGIGEGRGKVISENRNRLAFMENALEESAAKTYKWLAGSWVFYLLLMAVFLALFLIGETGGDKGFAAMVFVLNFLGFLGLWISPIRGIRGADAKISGILDLFHLPLSDRLAELRADNLAADPGERLQRAEELLREREAQERETRAWPNRLLGIVVITIIDLLVWLVWDEPVLALINQVAAMIINQIQITLAPTAAVKALKSPGFRAAGASRDEIDI